MVATDRFWSLPEAELFKQLNSGPQGLEDIEAFHRLQQLSKDRRKRKQWQKDILLFLSQFKNPLVLLLIFAVVLSMALGEYSNSLIIIFVLIITGIFGFIQERGAGRAVEKLLALVSNNATVKRNGIEKEIPFDEVVSGDILVLNAGDIVPADSLLLQANDLHVNESALTGESFPVEKFAGPIDAKGSLSEVTNSVFKGTHVINGSATALAVHTGKFSEVGKIAVALQKADTDTAFTKGIRQFGYLLMRITLIITLLILTLNILFHKPVVDSLLFALALAVGLAPELLPAIVTVTLSAGARRLARRQVIVKKLSAIQNLGEINVLCSDKTGTLTEGQVKVNDTVSVTGEHSDKVKNFIFRNAWFETGFKNPIDESIRSIKDVDVRDCVKKDEVPYDFIRKRLSVVVEDKTGTTMITKGAFDNILQCCTQAELPDGSVVPLDRVKEKLGSLFYEFSSQGLRTLAVCYKDVSKSPVIDKDDEREMIFLGLVTFSDPPKEGIVDCLHRFKLAGVDVKLVTGDNQLVAKRIAAQIGLRTEEILTGSNLHDLSDVALQRKVNAIDVFAEIEPMQKERVIRALQKNGQVVGYLGDGINDANALKASDAGISTNNAVDVAKEAAPIVLLEKDIDVVLEGIMEGRKTFINTLKYIFYTSSANFGNIFSMAIASLVLPFLPLLPVQILLNNFLSDMSCLGIASDKVDAELTEKPRSWDIKTIKRFMIVFGLQSSVFDMLTFGMLLFVFHTDPVTFRTGWFSESLLTQILVLLIIRTQRPFFKSGLSKYLLAGTVFTFCVAILLPYTPVGGLFQLVPLPPKLLVSILAIAFIYILTTELTKRFFINKYHLYAAPARR